MVTLDMEQLSRADRLRQAAYQRWGDGWTLETREYADGTRDHIVYHSRGRVDVDGESVLERDRLLFDDEGNIVHDRERATTKQQVDNEVIERRVDF